MNIISLCLSKGLGGLELYALRSATQLAKTESVMFVTSSSSRLEEKLRNENIDFKTINPSFRPLPLISAIKLAGIIDNFNTDILHMHWGKDLALAALAIKISKSKPALIYTRQMQITRMKTDFYHRFLYKEMSLMLAITNQLKERCAHMLGNDVGKRVKTLYYGVPAPEQPLSLQDISKKRQELNLDSSDFVIGLIGRLEDGKGQHLLIKAIAKAALEKVTLKAIIVGHEMDEGYRDELKKLATKLGVSNNILFMGFVDKPQEIMQLCNCILLATYMETFGLVLPEAMRCGIAVVGSNAGGVPEIIDHGETGLLFEPKNSDDLKAQLILLHNNRDKCQQLAHAGKKKADKVFNNEQHFNRLREIFQQQVGSSNHK